MFDDDLDIDVDDIADFDDYTLIVSCSLIIFFSHWASRRVGRHRDSCNLWMMPKIPSRRRLGNRKKDGGELFFENYPKN